jgi:hypothetical protein
MNIKDFNMTALLSTFPAKMELHDQPYLLRGASATLNLNLIDKVYSFSDIDQITFLLNQGKLLYWYKMFTYLVKSQDTEVLPGKVYFKDVKLLDEASGSLQCRGIFVNEPDGNPAEQDYFEVVDENHSWRDTWYLFDSRFNHHIGEGYEYISLVLFPEDTKHFKATPMHAGVDFEIVVRLNTDHLDHLANQDSIIIEPQHPIAVIDTLYGKI